MKTNKHTTDRVRKILRKSLGASYDRLDIRRVCSDGRSITFDLSANVPIFLSDLRESIWNAEEYLMMKNKLDYHGHFVCDPWVDESGDERIIIQANPDTEN